LLLRTRIISQLLPRNRDMGEMRYSYTRVPMDRSPAGMYRISSDTHGLNTSTEEGDMAYELKALLGKGTLAGAPLEYPTARLLPLHHGLQLLPLTRAFRSELSAQHPAEQTPHSASGEQIRVADDIADLARRLSEQGPVAYASADFHAGVGGQEAIVWQQGHVILAVTSVQSGAINQALHCLGVWASHPAVFDEFDMVGLGRWRSTEMWAEKEIRGEALEGESQRLLTALAHAEKALRELSPESPLSRIAQVQKQWAEQRLGELRREERGTGPS
jgi:hypothetical protein